MQNFKHQLQVYWNIRWLRRLVISAVSICVILLLIPVGLQFAIGSILKDQGAQEVTIEDINLNPFAGSIELTHLKMLVSNSEPAEIGHVYANVNILELLSSKIVVDQISISGMKTLVERDEKGNIKINGLNIPSESSTSKDPEETQTEESTALAFAVNSIDIQNITATYKEPDFEQNLNLNRLNLTGLKSWEADSTANLELDMALNQSPIKLSAALKLFEPTPEFKGNVSLEELAFSPFAKYYQTYLNNLEGNISVDSDFNIALAEQPTGNIESRIAIKSLDLEYQHIKQQSDSITWQGTTELVHNSTPVVQGELTISGSKTTDTKQNFMLASFTELALKDIEYQSQQVQLGLLDLQNLKLAQKEKDNLLLNLQQLNINDVNFDQSKQAININNIGIKQPLLQVTINEEKQLVQLNPVLSTIDELTQQEDTATSTSDSTQAVSNEQQETQNLSITIGKLNLHEPGKLKFTDLSVSPEYSTLIHFKNIELENISSSTPADFKLVLQQGEYTTFDINGNGLLLDPTQQIAFKANIKQLDLPPVTPYTTQAMGYGMKSGVIDSDIDVKITKREIDSLVDLKIDSIEVVETNKTTAEEVSSASGMSIDLAVSTLKDDNNVIELKLPIKGNLDKPDFDISLVVNKALGKAMQSASLSYLKHSLQPFGSLITLFNLAKAAANHISLPPIVFEVNSQEFKGTDQQELVEKVIKVLKERPALKIKACGISSLADQEAIKAELIKAETEKLKQQQKNSDRKDAVKAEIVIDENMVQQKMKLLADQRSSKVKSHFIDKGQLKSGRILNCLSTSNTEEDSVASVELQI